MEKKDNFQGSYEKRRRNKKSLQNVNSISSETVNKSKFVNKMLTEFKGRHQRVHPKQLEKINEIAKKYKRRTFQEALDLLLYCFELCEFFSVKLNVPIPKLREEILKYLPQSEADLIASQVVELLNSINLDKKDRDILEKGLISIIYNVKFRKKSAREVLKPLLFRDMEVKK